LTVTITDLHHPATTDPVIALATHESAEAKPRQEDERAYFAAYMAIGGCIGES
jgi:hypothetical protein